METKTELKTKRMQSASAQKETDRKLTMLDVKEIYYILCRSELLSVFDIEGRNREVLELRWGKMLEYSQIAELFGVTKERARQIYNKSVMKLLSSIKRKEQQYKRMAEIENENIELRKTNHALMKRCNELPEEEKKLFGNPKALEIHIEDLELSVRPYNCLKAARIETIGDILKFKPNELLRFRNFGRKALNEIEHTLAKRGFYFSKAEGF